MLVDIQNNLKKSKPIPMLNSLMVTAIVLSYHDTHDGVVQLLLGLSHTTRAYCVAKEDDLSQWLTIFPNNLTLRESSNLGQITRNYFKEVFTQRSKGQLSYGKF